MDTYYPHEVRVVRDASRIDILGRWLFSGTWTHWSRMRVRSIIRAARIYDCVQFGLLGEVECIATGEFERGVLRMT